MPNGLCPSCGAPAGADGGQCARCGASLGRLIIELTPSVPSPGRSRPVVVATKPRPGFVPLLALLAVVAVIAGIVAVVIGGGGSTDGAPAATIAPTTTTASASPTTVARQAGVTYLDNTPGPIFRQPAAGTLYVADGSLLKQIDLATGAITKSAAVSLSGASGAAQVVPVDGGVFVVYKSGDVIAFDRDQSKAPVRVGDGGSIVPTGSGAKVWVARDWLCTECATTVWYESDLNGPTGASLELSKTVTPVAAVEKGLLWQTPSGVFMGRSKSSTHRYASGTLVGALGDTVVWFGCDDAAGIGCRYHVGSGSDATQRDLDVVADLGKPSGTYLERLGAFPLSPDGRTVLVPRADGRLFLLDSVTGAHPTVAGGTTSLFRVLSVSWTGDRRWIVLHTGRTTIRAVETGTGVAVDLTLPIDSTGDVAVAVA